MLAEQRRDAFTKMSAMEDRWHDLEAVLPIKDIRVHTKTEDIPTVTDTQLRLYRKAAFEMGEAYTGLLVRSQRVIREAVPTPLHNNWRRDEYPFFTFKTKYAFAHNHAFYFGFGTTQQVAVSIGGNTVRLPLLAETVNLNCCCPKDQETAQLQYYAGYQCVDDIPATFLLGALKFISHAAENPGDIVIVTTATGGATSRADMQGSANPALTSGAIDIWKTLVADAI